MGRIVISNLDGVAATIQAHYSKAGYINDKVVKSEAFSIARHNKIGYTNSSRCFENGDFVLFTGSCIPLELCADIAQYIYTHFNKNITAIRQKIVGCYCIVIKKDKKIYVFVDDFGTYKTYYNLDNDSFTFSNTLFAIASSLKPKVSKLNLLELTFQHAILGTETIFEGVYRLTGEEYLELDIENNKIEVREIQQTYHSVLTTSDVETMVSELGMLFRKYIGLISQSFDKISVNMTGGLDSRLILAAFLSSGHKPLLLYGRGNSPITNTKDKDLEVTRLIAEAFSLDLHMMNWNDESGFYDEVNLRQSLNKYDEYYHLYGANANIFKEYETLAEGKTNFTEFGYFGEVIRNLPWIEKARRDPLGFSDVSREYQYVDLAQFSGYGSEYKRFLKSKIQSILKDVTTEGEGTKISKDEFQRFHAKYRYFADSDMANFMNSFNSSAIICAIPEIHNYLLRIPFNIKSDSSFQLRLINNLFPGLLEIPFFSHTQEWVFQKQQFKLTPLKKAGVKTKAVPGFVRNNAIVRGIYSKARLMMVPLAKKDKEELKKAAELKAIFRNKIEKLQQELNLELIDPKRFYGDVRYLVKYYQLLFLIKNL